MTTRATTFNTSRRHHICSRRSRRIICRRRWCFNAALMALDTILP